MKIENLVIIAIVAFLLFSFMKKPKTVQTSNTTQQQQLPSPSQVSQDDGGAARALISEGIQAGKEIAHDLISIFKEAEENAGPETQSNTW